MKNDIKQRILLEASQFVLGRGVKAMTMDELARRMGISKRTIYENFQNKDNLLTELFSYHKKKDMAEFKKILKESPTVLHALSLWGHNSEKQFSKLLSVYDEVKRHHPAVYRKIILEAVDQGTKNIEKVLQLGIKQGVFRKDLEVDVAAFLLFSFVQRLESNTHKDGLPFPVEKLHTTYMNIFFRGCCNSKGLQLFERVFETRPKIKTKKVIVKIKKTT